MPFSGKTTLGRSIARCLNSPYVSLDEINEARGLFGGDGISIEEWEKTHQLAMQQLGEQMKSGKDIVLDDTSCFRWLRDRFRNFGSQYGYQTIIVWLDIPLTEIWHRIRKNNETQIRHTVREDIVEEMAKTFEIPQDDEKTIGYTQNQPIDLWMAKHIVQSNI